MKTEKILNFIIVLLFVAAITVPLVLADFEGGQASLAENRYLATFPTFFENGEFVFQPAEFDSWINDNIGGRSIAQRIEGSLSYLASGVHKGDVIEGSEKWLYLLPDYDMPEYSNSNLPTPESLQSLCEGYQNIAAKLEEQDIGFVLAMYPRKYHVYPEYMPNTLRKVNEISSYEMITEQLQQVEGLNYIDLLELLVDKKTERLTYYKAYDASHWNNYGAFLGYQRLMAEIQKVIPEISILTEDDFYITEHEFQTVKDNGFETTETDLVYTLKNNQAVSDKEYLFQLGFNGTDPWQSYNYYRNTNDELPKAIIIGDSFTWMFQLPNLAQSFSELVFVHYNDLSQVNSLIAQVKPDVVVGAFLSAAIWSTYAWEPAETEVVQGIKPVLDYKEWGYLCVDYVGTTPVNGNTLVLNKDDALSFLEGWALDPAAGLPAGSVVIQVGESYYEAEYGKERASVAEHFQNDDYLNCGYVINIPTQELIEAGRVIIHIISADGSYQYPPSMYSIRVN